MRYYLKKVLFLSVMLPVPAVLAAESGLQQEVSAVSGSFTLTSQYVARGFRNTWGNPAIQGSIEYARDGWVSGIWASSVSDNLIRGASVEWNVYTGWSGRVGKLNFGALVYYYIYPGAKSTPETGNTRFDYGEIVPHVGYGPLTIAYNLTYTRDYFGANSITYGGAPGRHSRGSGYLDVSFNQELGAGWAVNAHYGHQEVTHFAEANFHDLKVAVSKQFNDEWNIELAWAVAWDKLDYYKDSSNGDPGAPVSDPTKQTFFVAISRSF